MKDYNETDSTIESRSDQGIGSREEILGATDITLESHEIKEGKETENIEADKDTRTVCGQEYGRTGVSDRMARRMARGRTKGCLRGKTQKMEDHNETDSTVENYSDGTTGPEEEILGAAALEKNIFNIFSMGDDEGESSFHDTQSESNESIEREDQDN